jgi:hypothetical protein
MGARKDRLTQVVRCPIERQAPAVSKHMWSGVERD